MRRALLLFALGFLPLGAPAQTTSPDSKSVSEPEFADVFFRVDAGTLLPLERQNLTFKGKARGFMVMNMKTVSEFPGGKSPVRFKAGQPLDFVVRTLLAPSAVDPNTTYCLRKVDAKKKTRELVIMAGHASPLGASSTVNFAGGAIPVNFSKYGSSSLKVSITNLPPGEYALGRTYGPAVFCFGMD